MKKLLLSCIIFFHTFCIFAGDTLSYKLETFGSVAGKSTTPFWIVTNTYGTVPLRSNNVYLRGSGLWKHNFSKDLQFNAVVDLIGATKHSSSFYVQQLYGDISFKSLHLNIGQKEYYNSMLDRELSTGDFDYSTNARPIPEINLNIPNFTPVPYTKKILQVRGDFAFGKSTDNNYIQNTKYPGENYALDILWHHKSVFFLIEDPNQHFPLSLTLGFEDAAQWGGWTSFFDIGELPHSFSDFIKVVLGEDGGEGSPVGEQINVLGNHQGTYNFKLTYKANAFAVGAYKQHYFDDKSGMEYANWRDGIWGIECSFLHQPYLRKLVFEYINTSNQSGPFHFLDSGISSRGGGNDDYYNHDLYISGWSHWGRTLGNPLITSPEYSNDGVIYFQNNRVKAFHLGFNGNFTDELSYRILGTASTSWGRMLYPFLATKNNFSSLLEGTYTPSKWNGWAVSMQLALDHGSLYGNNVGGSLKISKRGVFLKK